MFSSLMRPIRAVCFLLLAHVAYAQTPVIQAVTSGGSAGSALTPGGPANVFGNNFGTSTAITVTVSGKPAFVAFATAQQLIIQIPWDVPPGTAALRVAGSAPFDVVLVAYSPKFFTLTAPLRPNGSSVTAANPALPGDQVSFILTGLGPTNPVAPLGPAAGVISTAVSPEVKVGSQRAQVYFSGLQPATAGFYALNIRIPLVPPGSADVTVSIGGGSDTRSLPIGAPPGPVITYVSSASDFGAADAFGSGSWLEIKGSGLARTTRLWGQSDFNGNNAPTSMDGTSVTINGKPAYIYYISPTQVNVQAPNDSATGIVPVVVTAPGGAASSLATRASIVPGLLAPASFVVGGKQYLAALFPDGAYVGRPGLIPGVAFRTARPGDTIIFYGIGFGNVNPPVLPGAIATQATTLTSPLTVQFGNAPATLLYQGLSPNYVGLYQFNVVVPPVADGDVQIRVALNGAPLAQTVYLTIQN